MKFYILPICLFAFNSSANATWKFESQARQTSLIELYTSEGCSSCPPAEQRMNELEKEPGLWTDFVPVAFHVDYWNYIGWTDRFSSPVFTARQRLYSKHWEARTVYTPCFVKNGKAVRTFLPKPGNRKPGKLEANITGSSVRIEFTPGFPASGKMTAWVAPLSGMEITQVKTGENRGRTLKHCFVALDLRQETMKSAKEIMTAEIKLDGTLEPQALAVWITHSDSQIPIQATGGWLHETR